MSSHWAGPLLILVTLAAGLHLFRLSEPRSAVFDEAHFDAFVNTYASGRGYVYDFHPPHAKLIIAEVAMLGGYRGEQTLQRINSPITEVSPVWLRIVPALAGSALPLVVFALLIQLGASRWGAFAGALAIALDNALLIQTRIMVLDGVLLIATFGALSAYLRALGTPSRTSRARWCLGAGGLVGLAVGTKFTGLTALGLIGLVGLVEIARSSTPRPLLLATRDALWIAWGAIAVYFGGWAWHVWILEVPGPELGGQLLSGSFLTDVVRLHSYMLAGNYSLATEHPYSSPWWSWPLMLRPISYWSSGGTHLHLLGNPVVWWGCALGMLWVLLLVPWTLLRAKQLGPLADDRAPWPTRLWIPLAGWALAFLPLAAVPRSLFLYHYLTALVFSVCVVALCLDRVGWTRDGSFAAQPRRYHGTLVALGLGFLLAAPFTLSYLGFPAVQAYQEHALQLFPKWLTCAGRC